MTPQSDTVSDTNNVISSLRAERAKHVKELATIRAELAEAKRREDDAINDAHRLRDELNDTQVIIAFIVVEIVVFSIGVLMGMHL